MAIKLLYFTATVAAHVLVKPKEALARGFRVEDDCAGCGICASVCPVGNVALSGGRNEKSRARYRNPQVS